MILNREQPFGPHGLKKKNSELKELKTMSNALFNILCKIKTVYFSL